MNNPAAVYQIRKHDEEAWTDLAESSPRLAVRLAAESPDEVATVTVNQDGTFESDVPIESQPTFQEDEHEQGS